MKTRQWSSKKWKFLFWSALSRLLWGQRRGDQWSLHVCAERSANVRLKERFTWKKWKYPYVVPILWHKRRIFVHCDQSSYELQYVLFLLKKVHFSRKSAYYRNNVLWNNIFKWEQCNVFRHMNACYLRSNQNAL